MRRIVTAITAVSLAFSLVAMATPANAAVAGYDSAYAGESAFLNLNQGQTGTFTVFFANTGSTSWVRGSSSQVDLAACLEDKVTCNAQDASEAPFNSGWLSATRYTTQTQTTVAPGQIGTFTYNVTVPAAQASGTYRFNGALVLASSGADIHNEGYYQDVTVGTPTGAASITSLNPTSGRSTGGETVTITGSGFVCTPAFPTVNFGANTATVTSCGSTQINVTTPAGAVGTVNVTVTNAGAPASNALPYTYADQTRPTYNTLTVAGNQATVTFSEPVCRNAAWAGPAGAIGDWEVTVNGVSGTYEDTTDFIPICDPTTSPTNGVTTSTLLLGTSAPPGSFVAVTLTAAGGAKIIDAAGNTTVSPRTNTATATSPETTRPTVVSASAAPGTNQLVVTFSEPVYCADAREATDLQAVAGSTTLTLVSDNCPATAGAAATQVTFTMSGNFASATSYTVTSNMNAGTTENDELQDVAGNDLADPTTFTFTAGAADFTPPTMTDARLVNNLGTSDFSESGDAFSVTFSEKMNGSTTGTIGIQDQDGSTATITCGTNATCSWNTAVTTLNVVLSTTLVVGAAPGGPGSTPGMQIPFNITSLGGITDTSGNPPNVLGSTDRLVDYE